MPGWITLPRLFLVAAPTAMLLAASALAAGERRAGARRAREALGRPAGRVDAAAVGARVVLEGRIEVVDGPCACFEDGAPAAAATVEAIHEGAVPPGADPRIHEGMVVDSIARTARAAELALVVGAERVALAGPVEVRVGSRETDPDAPFASLAPGVRERVALVAGAGALPGPGAVAPVLARPLFRSLRAGDRVRAAGVLTRRSEGDRAGYRERARFCLSGDGAAPVLLAYDGAPRFAGALASVARGVRRVERLRAALLAVVLLGAFAVLAALQHRSRMHAVPHPATSAAAPAAAPHRPLADPVECAALRSAHAAAVAPLSRCDADADCAAEVRGGALYELEGCYRFRNRALPEAPEPTRIRQRWMDLGCAHTYELCPSPPQAMCREGRCVERPPPPLPETWRRHEERGAFYFYLPPGTERVAEAGADSSVVYYKGAGIDLITEYGSADPPPPAADHDLSWVVIGGRDARIWRRPGDITISFEDERACVPPHCPALALDDRLTLRARCDTGAACADAWLALQSVRFW